MRIGYARDFAIHSLQYAQYANPIRTKFPIRTNTHPKRGKCQYATPIRTFFAYHFNMRGKGSELPSGWSPELSIHSFCIAFRRDSENGHNDSRGVTKTLCVCPFLCNHSRTCWRLLTDGCAPCYRWNVFKNRSVLHAPGKQAQNQVRPIRTQYASNTRPIRIEPVCLPTRTPVCPSSRPPALTTKTFILVLFEPFWCG